MSSAEGAYASGVVIEDQNFYRFGNLERTIQQESAKIQNTITRNASETDAKLDTIVKSLNNINTASQRTGTNVQNLDNSFNSRAGQQLALNWILIGLLFVLILVLIFHKRH